MPATGGTSTSKASEGLSVSGWSGTTGHSLCAWGWLLGGAVRVCICPKPRACVLFACKHQAGPAGLYFVLLRVLHVGGTAEGCTLPVAICVAVPVGVLCLQTGKQQPGMGTASWAPAARQEEPQAPELLKAAAMCNFPQHSSHLHKEKLTVCLA